MDIEDKKAIKKILDTPEGRELLSYIARKVLELNSVKGCDLNDPVEATIELKARIRAYDKLESILKPLLALKDYDETKGEPNPYSM